jgi:hypothetical protein
MSKSRIITNEIVRGLYKETLKPQEEYNIVSGRYIDFDSFIPITNSGIVYSYGWEIDYKSDSIENNFFGACEVFAEASGLTMEYEFDGKNIGIFGQKDFDTGALNIYIDDEFVETVNTYSANQFERSLIWQKTDLTDANHIIKVETANATYVGISGFTFLPNEGLKLQHLSDDLYYYAISATTNANGYYAFTFTAPEGYDVYHIANICLQKSDMDSATYTALTMPAWRGTEAYIFYGIALHTYNITIGLRISKI